MKRPYTSSVPLGVILVLLASAPGRAAEPPHRQGPPNRLHHVLQTVQEMVEKLETSDAKAKGEIIEKLKTIRNAVSRHMDRGRGFGPEGPGGRFGAPLPGGPGHHPPDPSEPERLQDELNRIQAIIKENTEAGREIPQGLLRSKLRLEHRQRELREGELFRPRRLGPGGPPLRGEFGQVKPPPPLPSPLPPDLDRPLGPPGPPMEMDKPEAIIEMLERIAPEWAREARDLLENNPREFRHRLRRMLPEMRRLRQLRRKDPEAFERTVAERKIEWRVRHLAERARRGNRDDRERHVAELREHLNELFEVRMRNRDAKISAMQRELEKLREDQERRRAQRDQLIERRFEELLGESLDF